MAFSRKWLLPAALVLIAALGAGAAGEFAPPRIQAVPVPGDEPLTLRFAVSNRGFLRTFGDMDFTCVADSVTGRDAKGVRVTARGTSFPLNVNIDLGPRESFQYTCPIRGAHLPVQVDHIEAHVEAAYDSYGARANAHSPEFLWDAQSKAWVTAGR